MIPHSFCRLLCAHLEARVPALHAYCYTSTGEVKTPYVVLTVTPDEERIKGNHTWEATLTADFHAKAHETKTEYQESMFREICAVLNATDLRNELNGEALDFYLYSLKIDTSEEPSVADNTFTQSVRMRAVIQF